MGTVHDSHDEQTADHPSQFRLLVYGLSLKKNDGSDNSCQCACGFNGGVGKYIVVIMLWQQSGQQKAQCQPTAYDDHMFTKNVGFENHSIIISYST